MGGIREISAGPLNLKFSGMWLVEREAAVSGGFLSITVGLEAMVGRLSALVTLASFGGGWLGGMGRKRRVR